MTSSVTSEASVPDFPSRDNAAATPYRWIINPVFDFLFVWGGGVFIMLALNFAFLGIKEAHFDPRYPTGAESLLFIAALVAMYVFSDSHIFATHMRIWGSTEDRARFKLYRTWLTLALVPVFAIGMQSAAFTGALLNLFLLTSIWHWSMQAFGIGLIYCQKQGYPMNRLERETFRYFIYALSAFFITRMLVFPERFTPSSFVAVPVTKFPPLPEVFYWIACIALITMVVAFGVMIANKLIVQRMLMPLPVLSQVLFLSCFGLAEDTARSVFWFYGPGFFHGSQYMAVALSHHLKTRGLPEGMPTSQISKLAFSWPGLSYLGTAIAGGLILYVGFPAFWSLFSYDRIMVAGLVLGTLSLHHIITDAAIWRLRDPRCRQLLIS